MKTYVDTDDFDSAWPHLTLGTIKRYQAKAAHLTTYMTAEYAGTLLARVRS